MYSLAPTIGCCVKISITRTCVNTESLLGFVQSGGVDCGVPALSKRAKQAPPNQSRRFKKKSAFCINATFLGRYRGMTHCLCDVTHQHAFSARGRRTYRSKHLAHLVSYRQEQQKRVHGRHGRDRRHGICERCGICERYGIYERYERYSLKKAEFEQVQAAERFV